MKTTAQLQEIARGAIERHLGDVCHYEPSADEMRDEAFVLAHEALLAVGVAAHVASWVAGEVVHEMVA